MTKRFLAIIILGLFWCNLSFAKPTLKETRNKDGKYIVAIEFCGDEGFKTIPINSKSDNCSKYGRTKVSPENWISQEREATKRYPNFCYTVYGTKGYRIIYNERSAQHCLQVSDEPMYKSDEYPYGRWNVLLTYDGEAFYYTDRDLPRWLVEKPKAVAKKPKKAFQSKLSKEEINKLKAEIKENGVIPYERGIVADESEYALLIQEQHEFVKTEKAIILNDIDKSKKLCIEMGFSETTFLIFKNEKFNQCVLTIWKTELMGKKYVKMQKELNSQLAEIEQKQIELDHVASALNRTRNQQMAYTYEIEETQQSSSFGLESLIKGALGIAAGYYLGQAIGGSSGTSGQTSGNTTILRGYRCTLHPTAFDC